MMIKKGNKIFFISPTEQFEKLPLGNYILLQNEVTKEFYLEVINDFTLPTKIYGDEEGFAEKVVNTYKKRSTNLGVLLTGLKGSGKTLCAKLICQKIELPIVNITQSFTGSDFIEVLQKIGDNVVLFFDEFEKRYKTDEQQEQFLSVLDGIFIGKKLFIFTTNSFGILQYFKSRPSRIRYVKKYNGLAKETINEVINDLLVDKKKKDSLLGLIAILGSISIDSLKEFIAEMNLYNEDVKSLIKTFNLQVEHSSFEVRMYISNKLHYSKVNYNPLTAKYIAVSYKDTDKYGERWFYYEREYDEMQINIINNEFQFKDRDGNTLIFTPSKPFEFEL